MVLPLLLSACAYEVPLDPDGPGVTNVLSGTVVLDGPDAAADTVILLFPADEPPPPEGTGRPISFASVPASGYTQDAGGLAAAPWALTKVPDGEWLVTALMDPDKNFMPLLGATAGSTCGDWLGAYFSDLETSTYATISVSGGRLIDDITVAVGRENTIQRPAWQFTVNDTYDTTITTGIGQSFEITSIPIHSDLGFGDYDLDGPYDGSDPCETAFWQYAPDEDGDGVADPHPNENFSMFKSLWPRVYLRYATDDMEEGEYYGSEAIASQTFTGTGLPPVNTPTPVTTLDLYFMGKAIHFHADGTEELVSGDDIPKGDWAVTVVQYTGQTWTVPNELVDYPSTDDAFDPAPQGLSLTIE